jgi:hypothetical protein
MTHHISIDVLSIIIYIFFFICIASSWVCWRENGLW